MTGTDLSESDIPDADDATLERIVAEWRGWDYDEPFDCWHQPSGLGTVDHPPQYTSNPEDAWRLFEWIPKGDPGLRYEELMRIVGAEDMKRALAEVAAEVAMRLEDPYQHPSMEVGGYD